MGWLSFKLNNEFENGLMKLKMGQWSHINLNGQ